MKLAQKFGTEYLELGILLGFPSHKARQIIHDNKYNVPINFTILEAWRESMKRGSVRVMYDKLCEVLLNIGRKYLVEYVRGECLFMTYQIFLSDSYNIEHVLFKY